MKRSLLFFFFACWYIILAAQTDCSQEAYQTRLLQLHPLLAGQYNAVEFFTRRHSAVPHQHGTTDTASNHPVPDNIVVPVVVHILWNNKAEEVSDAQVLSQLEELNQDFGGYNSDRSQTPGYFGLLATGTGISFALAKTGPDGQPTSGIVRKQTGIRFFGFDDKAKSTALGGDDAWNADRYLNIWVCHLDNGISGYASVPGSSKEKDGVVINSAVFGTINIGGPYNKGRTAVHETGHWLNLRHLWGNTACGDDMVDDTPTQQGPNRGCHSGEQHTCGNTAHGDMYMNFMDFSDDACMHMFTAGQRQRMRTLFEEGGPRHALLSSDALNGQGLPLTNGDHPAGFNINLYPNPAVAVLMVRLTGQSVLSGQKICISNQLGQIVRTIVCTNKWQQFNISTLPAGLYFVKMNDRQSNAIQKFVKQ